MTKPEWITVVLVAVGFGGLLFTLERSRGSERSRGAEPHPPPVDRSLSSWSAFGGRGGNAIAAPGFIEGRSEPAALRPAISERIIEISVKEGEWVRQGATLVRLDATAYRAAAELAEADRRGAEARLNRLLRGARESEIEELRALRDAARAEAEGAEMAYRRVLALDRGQAASPQMVEDHRTRWHVAEAAARVAAARLATIEAPPREEEVEAARAAVASALARVDQASARLAHTELLAPSDGRVLEIHGRVGELATPDQPLPLIRFADNSRLQVRADIDEYDALKVSHRQTALVRTDSLPGKALRGSVVRIGAAVRRKSRFPDRPGERLDSFLREVWIELDNPPDLPIGLPVDVWIDAGSGPAAAAAD